MTAAFGARPYTAEDVMAELGRVVLPVPFLVCSACRTRLAFPIAEQPTHELRYVWHTRNGRVLHDETIQADITAFRFERDERGLWTGTAVANVACPVCGSPHDVTQRITLPTRFLKDLARCARCGRKLDVQQELVRLSYSLGDVRETVTVTERFTCRRCSALSYAGEEGGAPSVASGAKRAAFTQEQDLAVAQQQGRAEEAVRVLFLSASPMSESRLDLEEEIRDVDNVLKATGTRPRLVLVSHPAARIEDLVESLREDRPIVVHFSGHGSDEGILLRSEASLGQALTGAQLARLLDGRGVGLVVLNACFTGATAEALLGAVRTVVGTSNRVTDDAAKLFSVEFYRQVGRGYTIKHAFQDATEVLMLHGFGDVYGAVGDLEWAPG